MAAPDFYFAINAIFRHIHDRHGKPALIRYWRELGREYYRTRIDRWREGGPSEISTDWERYFAEEPAAIVEAQADDQSATLEVHVCPAIKHLRDSNRDIVPYFCEHCDHIVGAMADEAGYRFERTGGMGSCRQRFVRVSISGRGSAEA